MYGSSLMRVTLRPRDSRIAAREAEAIPLPREDTTPPVTKTNLVMSCRSLWFRLGGNARLYRGSLKTERKGRKDAQRTQNKNSKIPFAPFAKPLRPLRS